MLFLIQRRHFKENIQKFGAKKFENPSLNLYQVKSGVFHPSKRDLVEYARFKTRYRQISHEKRKKNHGKYGHRVASLNILGPNFDFFPFLNV